MYFQTFTRLASSLTRHHSIRMYRDEACTQVYQHTNPNWNPTLPGISFLCYTIFFRLPALHPREQTLRIPLNHVYCIPQPNLVLAWHAPFTTLQLFPILFFGYLPHILFMFASYHNYVSLQPQLLSAILMNIVIQCKKLLISYNIYSFIMQPCKSYVDNNALNFIRIKNLIKESNKTTLWHI